MGETYPSTEPGSKNHQVFASQDAAKALSPLPPGHGQLANCSLYPWKLSTLLFLPINITFEDNNSRLKHKNSLSFCTPLPFSREMENSLLCLDMCECQSGEETLFTSWWWVTVAVFFPWLALLRNCLVSPDANYVVCRLSCDILGVNNF